MPGRPGSSATDVKSDDSEVAVESLESAGEKIAIENK
jgi:hypothetical protein